MRGWEGLERFLQVSLGSQVGASGVALIAVLELKRIVQQQPGFRGKIQTSSVRLTAEEWRIVAGIHERKTFERARNKLEELGVLSIKRDGKLLVVELWPDRVQTEEKTTACSPDHTTSCSNDGLKNETSKVLNVSRQKSPINRAKGRKLRLVEGSPERLEITCKTDGKSKYGLSNEISLGTSSETEHGIHDEVWLETNLETGYGTTNETGYETSSGTSCGTIRETSSETSLTTSSGITSETGTVSQSQRALLSMEDVVFHRQNVSKEISSKRDNELMRYPLNRYTLDPQTKNRSNAMTNNDQRTNECVGETSPELGTQHSEGESLLEFAICWVEETGHPLTPYEKEGLDRFLTLGYTEDLLLEALRCAVAADNRRMGYVLGILRNWYQEGVRSVEDLAVAKKHWEDLRFLKRAKIG